MNFPPELLKSITSQCILLLGEAHQNIVGQYIKIEGSTHFFILIVLGVNLDISRVEAVC